MSDLVKVNNVLAGAMIFLGGKANSIDEGEKIADDLLKSGKVYDKFLEMVTEHGGNIEYINDFENLKRARYPLKVTQRKKDS